MKFKFLIFLFFVPFLFCATHYKWLQEIVPVTNISQNRSLTCVSLYTSVEHRPIYECHDISSQSTKNTTIMVVGGIHGNEPLGRELIAQILSDDDWRASLPDIHVVWVPDMNPDGFHHQRRDNSQGLDLNRSFPDHCDNTFVDKNVPEVNGMMELLTEVHPDLLLMFHGGARVVVWGADESCVDVTVAMPTPLTPEAEQFAITCANAYAAHDVNKTIEGSAWYPIRGSMQDWAFYNKHTTAGMVVEMGPKQPTAEEVPQLLASHKAALQSWITTMAAIL